MKKEGGLLSDVTPIEDDISLLFLQIAIILITDKLLARLFKYAKQPSVVAEVFGGILLGPSILGHIPGFKLAIFPSESLSLLQIVADVGLIFYLFVVGLELDIRLVQRSLRQTAMISFSGIGMDMVFSAGLSYVLYNTFPTEAKFSTFYAYIAVVTSVTSLSVLARILGELRLFSTRVGSLAVASSVWDDLVAWSLLALAMGLSNSGSQLNALYIILMALGFVAFMAFVVKPVLAYVLDNSMKSDGRLSNWALGLISILIIVFGIITQMLGIHFIFGAFILGAVAIPRGQGFEIVLTEKFEDLITVVFLPLYFTLAGMKADVSKLTTGTSWGVVFLGLLCGLTGKLVGCTTAAHYGAGFKWREAISLGALMCSKGLVELIILNIGFEAQVLNESVYTVMVIVAICCTIIVTPAVSNLYPPSYYRKKEELGKEDTFDHRLDVVFGRFRPMVCLPSLKYAPITMKLLRMFAGHSEEAKKMAVHAVRLIESDSTSSDIMKARRAVIEDPMLEIFDTFSHLEAINLHTHIAIAPFEDLTEEIRDLGEANQLNMVIIPWQHPQESTTAFRLNPNKRHHMFVKNLLIKWRGDVAVVLDRGTHSMPTAAKPHILVPFFGGPDDRAALAFAMRMSHRAGTRTTVLHIQFANGAMDPEDTKLLEDIHQFEQRKAEGNAEGQAYLEFVDIIEASSSFHEPFKPILEQVSKEEYQWIVIGHLGSRWVKEMGKNEKILAEFNDKGQTEEVMMKIHRLFKPMADQPEIALLRSALGNEGEALWKLHCSATIVSIRSLNLEGEEIKSRYW